MHDGRLATLEDVVEFYSEGGRPNPYLDPEITPRHFSVDEERALAAFLRSLTALTARRHGATIVTANHGDFDVLRKELAVAVFLV